MTNPAPPAPVGDQLTAALLPALTDLIMAVHNRDQDAVSVAFAAATDTAGDELAAAKHLAIMGAALGRPDLPLVAQLAWTVMDGAGA